MQDSELLKEYKATGSEAAFEGLAKRHMDVVYAKARRQMGDDATAQEVTQKVFCLLAAKAGKLAGRKTVAGWYANRLGALDAAAREAFTQKAVSMEPGLQSVFAAKN